MRKSKRTKSNDPVKILRMISRDEDLERRDGKFQCRQVYKDKTKYNRKKEKRELGKMELSSHFCFQYV